MGTSLRVFIVDSKEGLHPLPRTRYEGLLRGEPEACLPDFAGQRVRCAVVVVEMSEQKPVAVSRIVYSFLSLDDSGRLDITERERETRLAMDSIPPLHSPNPSPQVIDARHYFARKRYEREFRWRPSKAIETAILDNIFGRDTPL